MRDVYVRRLFMFSCKAPFQWQVRSLCTHGYGRKAPNQCQTMGYPCIFSVGITEIHCESYSMFSRHRREHNQKNLQVYSEEWHVLRLQTATRTHFLASSISIAIAYLMQKMTYGFEFPTWSGEDLALWLRLVQPSPWSRLRFNFSVLWILHWFAMIMQLGMSAWLSVKGKGCG